MEVTKLVILRGVTLQAGGPNVKRPHAPDIGPAFFINNFIDQLTTLFKLLQGTSFPEVRSMVGVQRFKAGNFTPRSPLPMLQIKGQASHVPRVNQSQAAAISRLDILLREKLKRRIGKEGLRNRHIDATMTGRPVTEEDIPLQRSLALV